MLLQFFKDFVFQRAELYVSLHPRYCMPLLVHKILVYGGQVMELFLHPIRQFSEEAAEACSKDIKRFRKLNIRKIFIVGIIDLIHMKLVLSERKVPVHRQCTRKKFVA